jgi:hypothetical protein
MTPEFYTAKKGTIFHENTCKLYIFSPSSIQVLRGWPKPYAWKKTNEKPRWIQYWPSITLPKGVLDKKIKKLSMPYEHHGQLLLPGFIHKKDVQRSEDLAWSRWYETIPAAVRNIVNPYRDRQWNVLSLVACCGSAALDLAKSNPALAYALASNWIFHKPRVNQPLLSSRELLKTGRNQREILAWLGFSESDQIRRILRKVVLRSLAVDSLLCLRRSLQYPDVVKSLSHLDRINIGVIRIVTDPELFNFVTPIFLHEVSCRKDEDRNANTAWVLRECLDTFKNSISPERKFPVLNSLKKLHEFYSTMIEKLKHNIKNINNGTIDILFPHPPVSGIPNIIPLTRSHELIEEGIYQKNCAADYIEKVAISRDVYIYKVLFPERCTLSLEKNGNQWKIGQIARACNGLASEETLSYVKKWLKDNTCGEINA